MFKLSSIPAAVQTDPGVAADGFADELAAAVFDPFEGTDGYRWELGPAPAEYEPSGPSADDDAFEAQHWADTPDAGGWVDGDPGEPTGALSGLDAFLAAHGDEYAALGRAYESGFPVW